MTDANQSKSPGWTLFQGILHIVLGALAIAFPLFGTIVVEQLFAALLLIAGGYALAAALGRKESGAASRLVSGIWAVLTLVTGLLLMFQIGAGILTLTILLAAYFAAQGVVTLIAAFKFSGTGPPNLRCDNQVITRNPISSPVGAFERSLNATLPVGR